MKHSNSIGCRSSGGRSSRSAGGGITADQLATMKQLDLTRSAFPRANPDAPGTMASYSFVHDTESRRQALGGGAGAGDAAALDIFGALIPGTAASSAAGSIFGGACSSIAGDSAGASDRVVRGLWER